MRRDGPVLGFDTSAAHCAAGLFLDGRVVAARLEEMQRGQAERLFPVLGDLLADNRLVWRDLAAIGVGIGPGNFTGIRISVSAARGLALGLGVPAIGVSNFELLAEGQGKAPMLVALPAPRGAFYMQHFTDGRPAAAPAFLSGDAPPADPGAWHGCGVVGQGARQLAERLGGTSGSREVAVDPASIGPMVAAIAARKLAASVGDLPRPAPLYVRPADAAPMRDAPPVILP